MNTKTSEKKETPKNPQVPAFAFERKNYLLMIVGIVILLTGFLVMTMDKEKHGFGVLGLTVGPVIVMIGFLFQIFAILYKEKPTER